MILLDSNVFMYAAGAEHANKASSLALLERVARRDVDAFVDAEVLQEILHRYRAIGRWDQGRTVYDMARTLMAFVAPITSDTVDRARDLLDLHPRLSARDALHAASCQLVGNGRICSFDRDFDAVHQLTRLEPAAVL